MIETKTQKKTSPARHILTALGFHYTPGNNSAFEENSLNMQNSQDEFDVYEHITHRKALLEAERRKAEVTTALQRQRFI
jgi:hypothetical protein